MEKINKKIDGLICATADKDVPVIALTFNTIEQANNFLYSIEANPYPNLSAIDSE